MTKRLDKKIIAFITVTLMLYTMLPVTAESLFKGGISYSSAPTLPHSWFSSIRAANIGDLVTIVVEEASSAESTVELESNKKSSISDAWTKTVNQILPGKAPLANVDGFGGQSKVSNSASTKRTNTFKETITAQVVQVLPNGNLVVQGVKKIVNSQERGELIVSGIINPRLVDGNGQISSRYVGNLQVAVIGKGTVSRAQSDGVMNKLLRFLF